MPARAVLSGGGTTLSIERTARAYGVMGSTADWRHTYFKRKQRFLEYLERQHPLFFIALRRMKGDRCQLLPVEYPVDNAHPRYGYGHPPHSVLAALIARGSDEYRARLAAFAKVSDGLRAVPQLGDDRKTNPYWTNAWFTGLDAIVLYGMLSTLNPVAYVEIGSGHSTRFAALAIRANGLRTRILSIDPAPRTSVDTLCDERVRTGLEKVDVAIFDRLSAGDVLFFDGSHRSFVDTDVTVFFLDVLPRLPSGVLVQIHDIYLPNDYPPGNPFYNEQYLLGLYLLMSSATIAMPNAFVASNPGFASTIDMLWRSAGVSDVARLGSSFWFVTTGEPRSTAGRG